jgi:ABC-type multidrug transport system fused ATPase/permease subunit
MPLERRYNSFKHLIRNAKQKYSIGYHEPVSKLAKLDYKILQVGKFLQLVATFIGGFVVAFVKGWLLSLVMLACIPPVVIAGGVVSKILTKISSKGQESYSDAGNVVEQTLGAIKTVSSMASVISIEAVMIISKN